MSKGILERIALVTAKAEGCVTHRRLTELSKEHPLELTRILHGLVDKEILKSEGFGKGTFYYLAGEHPIKGDIVSASFNHVKSSEHLSSKNSEHLIANSEHLSSKNSEHNDYEKMDSCHIDDVFFECLWKMMKFSQKGQK